ncbi:two-component response regulator ORR21-like isoform X3 [Cucurbita pepo subsp. pepo]|uniref:two-component response regulator ORR21-like isoform X3 n=1 Tax=Cucurbita pepo subsp. pepo TaxID=3664 RepID=UPI000C9D7E45|nr:two-component response regulator ORR21-like isoform X3 [Cucurbita pepo subsp. pepo]
MELTKKWMLYEELRVLVVDHDSTTLKIVSKMLGVCGYEAVTAKCAIDALRIVKERKNDIHLILTDTHLPDMGRYELLEKIMEQTSTLPIVAMTTDDNEIVKLGCLFKGAMLCLVKPLTMKNIKDLWQFLFIGGRERSISIRTSNRVQKESTDENDVDKSTDKKSQKTKRKEHDEEEVSTRQVEGDGSESTGPKKPKLIWTQQLHKTFLQAIEALGVDTHPKEILQLMNVPGLRKENVSSHLQKFRFSLKRGQDVKKKTFESFETAQIPNHRTKLPINVDIFVAKPQETQPQLCNNLSSTSINSNLMGSCDVVSSESCFSKVITSQTCSMNSTQRRSLEDQERRQWFECNRKEMTSTMVEEQGHCMFTVDEELDGVLDVHDLLF